MKKIILSLAFMFAFVGIAHADDTILPLPVGNGNPSMVVNAWGTTNSQLPHIKPGVAGCPWFYSIDCVDISGTAYYKARFK